MAGRPYPAPGTRTGGRPRPVRRQGGREGHIRPRPGPPLWSARNPHQQLKTPRWELLARPDVKPSLRKWLQITLIETFILKYFSMYRCTNS